jgi:serine/threonine protein kinase
MEYLDGLNLHQLVAHYGPQPQARVGYILSHVAESLREAHDLGLIHRDIKPANVFLCDRGGEPDTVKVLDFGLVKHFAGANGESAQAEFVPDGGILGTPNFLAPESIRNHLHSDARSDLYAVGALGYFLLTGKYVFEGASVAEVCHKHLNETPVPPGRRLGRELTPALEAIILRCLEKDPARRPQSAGALLEALRGVEFSPAWTREARDAWWTAQRATRLAQASVTIPKTTVMEKTVRIEMADRTQ